MQILLVGKNKIRYTGLKEIVQFFFIFLRKKFVLLRWEKIILSGQNYAGWLWCKQIFRWCLVGEIISSGLDG